MAPSLLESSTQAQPLPLLASRSQQALSTLVIKFVQSPTNKNTYQKQTKTVLKEPTGKKRDLLEKLREKGEVRVGALLSWLKKAVGPVNELTFWKLAGRLGKDDPLQKLSRQ